MSQNHHDQTTQHHCHNTFWSNTWYYHLQEKTTIVGVISKNSTPKECITIESSTRNITTAVGPLLRCGLHTQVSTTSGLPNGTRVVQATFKLPARQYARSKHKHDIAFWVGSRGPECQPNYKNGKGALCYFGLF